jgi:uncharacterized repeat protein (TIGR03803 family)
MRQSHSTFATYLALIAFTMTLTCLCMGANAQTYSILYQFKSGNDGTYPAAGVVLDAKRVALYGTTYAGGDFSSGTVFKLNKSGETVLTALQANPVTAHSHLVTVHSPSTQWGTCSARQNTAASMVAHTVGRRAAA